MHIFVGDLLIIFHVQYGVLCLDQALAVIQGHCAGIDGCQIGNSGAAWIFDVTSHCFCTQRLAAPSGHFCDTLHPEIIACLYHALTIELGIDHVAERAQRGSRSHIIGRGPCAFGPLININPAASKQLTPASSSVDDAVLVGINESRSAGVPPHFTHMIHTPGGSDGAYRTGVVAGRILRSDIVKILSRRSQYFALLGIEKIEIFHSARRDPIVQKHRIQQADIYGGLLTMFDLPGRCACGVLPYVDLAIISRTAVTYITAWCPHPQQSTFVGYSGTKRI